eukprot:s148_g24.t1
MPSMGRKSGGCGQVMLCPSLFYFISPVCLVTSEGSVRELSNLIGAVSRVRNTLAMSTHQFFQDRGFLYVHTPIITTADCEGAGEMFRVSQGQTEKTDQNEEFFGRPAYLTAVPSLELVQSEDEALLADCREPGEPKEPSTQDLLQAICEFHKSILGQLTKIDHRMERLEERITKSKRRGSITSATSQSSHPQPSPSPSAKKLQVQGENLAMQALQMDISNLVPVRAARKSTATAIATASQSLGLGSWSLAGRQKQKDQGQGLAG